LVEHFFFHRHPQLNVQHLFIYYLTHNLTFFFKSIIIDDDDGIFSFCYSSNGGGGDYFLIPWVLKHATLLSPLPTQQQLNHTMYSTNKKITDD
jgi:hypothetical protein